jgi:hypothetical protein
MSSAHQDTHLDDRRLAAIASGERPTSEEERHLARCRRCAAGYAEIIRSRAEELAGRPAAPAEIVEAGHAFVRSHSSNPSPSPARRWRSLRWVAPGIAAAVVALFLFTRPGPPDSTSSIELPVSVHRALVAESAHGLVHPLVADADDFDAPVLRGDATRVDAAAIESLRAKAVAHPDSIGLQLAAVAGFQAAGQLANAHAYLDEALHRNPDSLELRALQIVQDYREGDADRAEERLRAWLADDPGDDLARLNLAILLERRGDATSVDESRTLAGEVAERREGSGLSLRAQRILDEMARPGRD